MDGRTQPRGGECLADLWHVVCTHLNDRTEFFVEQRTDQAVPARQRGKIDMHADMGREHHLGQRHHQATIRAVVVGQQLAVGEQGLGHVEERP